MPIVFLRLRLSTSTHYPSLNSTFKNQPATLLEFSSRQGLSLAKIHRIDNRIGAVDVFHSADATPVYLQGRRVQLDEIFQQIKASDDRNHVAEIVQCRSFCHGSAPLHAFAGRSENRITGQSARTRSRRPPIFSSFKNQYESHQNFHSARVCPCVFPCVFHIHKITLTHIIPFICPKLPLFSGFIPD